MHWVPLVLFCLDIVFCAIDEIEEPVILSSTSTTPAPILTEPDSVCYNVRIEACPPDDYICSCKAVETNSVVCCNIHSSFKLKEGLACAGVGSPNVRYLHLRNITLADINSANISWNNLESLSITDGHIDRISNRFISSIRCLNLSHNAIGHIDREALSLLSNLEYLDLSMNNLTKLPKINSKNLWMNLSHNDYLGCHSVRELLGDTNNVTFADSNSTYCLSETTFHWFNSTERLPLTQLKILHNIEENCTKGCTCAPHRLDMVAGKTPTVSVRVNCSALRLQSLPQQLPANTIILNVSYNNITSLDALILDKSYQHIREFYADSNQISSISALEGSKFIDNFLVLSLRENNIKSLPTYFLSNTFDRNYAVRHVNLGWNRLRCDCNVQLVKLWLLANKKYIPDYDQVLCEGTEEKVVELDQNKVCFYQRVWTDYIYYIIAGEVALLLLLIGKVSYDYWVFKTAGYLPWPASKMPKLPCDWVFE